MYTLLNNHQNLRLTNISVSLYSYHFLLYCHTEWSKTKRNIVWYHLYEESKRNDTNELTKQRACRFHVIFFPSHHAVLISDSIIHTLAFMPATSTNSLHPFFSSPTAFALAEALTISCPHSFPPIYSSQGCQGQCTKTKEELGSVYRPIMVFVASRD